ncbi:hypothetical protein CFII64_28279 [Pseudomonas sp. CFII64]|uniref:DUF4214 domain-containing protein n=1 Tax=Pseudomonas sp. CFII64 TaxID=911242 RepID=UPI00035783E7|nr:DUF4214 domain-containing protein [Pseudomonas sp. CFII64]EPJ75793.1 hypothetical protein CFII64_28279 [Pseudomonas sp. CFII64]
MATLKLYQPINMNTLQAWDGEFTIVNSAQIRVTDGVKTQDYLGNFQFSADWLSGGTLTSTIAYQNGLYYAITGLNVDAMTVERYIDNFDFNGALNEVLKGNDTVIGSSGNDLIKSAGGNDTIDGGSGVDTVFYAGTKSNVSVVNNGSSFTVKANGKVDTLTNVERVGMGDGSVLALDVKAGENTGSAYRLYQAAFDRKPDAAGLKFWTGALDSGALDVKAGENTGSAYRLYQAAFDRKPDAAGLKFWTGALDSGASATQVAQGFVSSKEFQTLNPGTDPTSLVNSYYQHVLHRPADAAGLAFWSDAMNHGTTSAQLLVSFSESQENINNTAADLNNGVWLV